MSKQLIIVSNRLPVSVTKEDGEIRVSPSAGGLATAMSSLDTGSAGRLWIGWPGIPAEDLTQKDKKAVTAELKKSGCYPVFLSRAQVEQFYDGYSNATLWPLFHYFQSTAVFTDEYWQSYREVNALFCDAVDEAASAEAEIWVHDYHLMLLPQMLREKRPAASIGFFLHIPFPSSEIFRLLPNRSEILQGLLGADLVGFHTYDYARHFMSSVVRILGLERTRGHINVNGRTVYTDSFPIGIDYQKYKAAVASEAVAEEGELLRNHYQNQRVILSVDRLDYSKGIPERLEAFEQLLSENPDLHKSVSLVMVAVPSRVEVESYKQLRDDIEQTVSRINGKYATVDWTPISYQFKNLPFEQLVALYIRADIALVTPLRDGMNLVAKEYVASKQNETGVLILSELAGAIDEMPEALRVLPSDTSSIVAAMKQGLEMFESEKLQRLASMQRWLARYTVQRWAKDFLEQLHTAKTSQEGEKQIYLSLKDQQRIAQRFASARKRQLFLDYDGTLRGFVKSFDPQAALPSDEVKSILHRLTQMPDTEVYIVSGRTYQALDAFFGDVPVSLIAEHGAWIKQHGTWQQSESDFEQYRSDIRAVLERYTDRTPGADIEDKSFALVWHYRNTPTELAYDRTTNLRHELSRLLEGTDIGIYTGNKIIEVKPRGINKGAAVEKLVNKEAGAFVLAAGDDYTDEDMFTVLPEDGVSIKVGKGETKAGARVAGVTDMLHLLEMMVSVPAKD